MDNNNIDIDKYAIFQKNTEKNKNFNLQYMALGLGGEVGEVLNEIKKYERDDNNILSIVRREKIITEMGDVLWYFQGLCNRLNISILDVMENNIEKIENRNNNNNNNK